MFLQGLSHEDEVRPAAQVDEALFPGEVGEGLADQAKLERVSLEQTIARCCALMSISSSLL